MTDLPPIDWPLVISQMHCLAKHKMLPPEQPEEPQLTLLEPIRPSLFLQFALLPIEVVEVEANLSTSGEGKTVQRLKIEKNKNPIFFIMGILRKTLRNNKPTYRARNESKNAHQRWQKE